MRVSSERFCGRLHSRLLQHGSDVTGSSRISSSEFVEFVRICENDWRLRPYLTMKGALVAVELDKFIKKGLKTTRQSTRQELTCLDERFRRRRRSYSWIAGYRTPYSFTDVRINRNELYMQLTVVWDHFAAPCSHGIAHRGVLPCTRKWTQLHRIPALRAL
jgi:hypothetical protein